MKQYYSSYRARTECGISQFFKTYLMVSVIKMCNLLKRLIRATFLSTPASDGHERSGDTGQRIPCFDNCQLITTLMYNMCAISVLLCYQTSKKVWDWTLVFLWCGRTGGLRAVYAHVITKFSRMGRFTYPWCSAGTLRAPELRYKNWT